MSLEARFAASLQSLVGEDERHLAVAVSGGGDSMALLHLAAGWARPRQLTLLALTVDHGLRPEAAAEAAAVRAACAGLGVPHEVLRWDGRAATGNLQDAARRARRALIEARAAEAGAQAVLTGHTLDDQAETVLLRLGRGSGVDGLAGMAPRRVWGLPWLRPLLGERREALRDWLREQGIGWQEDASNADARFARSRARALLERDLGLTAERLAATAAHMRRAQAVLDAAAAALAAEAVRQEAGDLVLALAPFGAAPLETRTRLLAAALCWISGDPYRPRYAALAALAEKPAPATLHGCRIVPARGSLRITRELAAVADAEAPADAVWDGRWRIEGPREPGQTIRAVGESGLSLCPARRAAGVPAAALAASPALWAGTRLVAAPLAGKGAGFTATLVPGRDRFTDALLPR